MELSDNQNTATVEGVQYSNDGTVTLNLSDKRKLKLALEKWSELGQPLNKTLSDKEQKVLEQESCCTLIRNKMLSFLARREHSAEELRRKLKQSSSISKTAKFSDLLERCLLEIQEKGFHSDEIFLCQICARSFKNKQNLRCHNENVHVENEEKKYKCDDCDKGFSSRTKLDGHKINVHIKSTPYSCHYEGCNRAYNDRSNRRSHEIKFHGGIYPKIS